MQRPLLAFCVVVAFVPWLVGGACGPAKPAEPCQRVTMRPRITSLTGGLVTFEDSFELSTCEITLSWTADIVDSTPTEQRFTEGRTTFIVKCGDEPEIRVSNGALFERAPIDSAPPGDTVSFEALKDGQVCRYVGDATFTADFEARQGGLWPDAQTPVSTGFEQVFTLTADIGSPDGDPLTGERGSYLCDVAKSTQLQMTATFIASSADFETEQGLSCGGG